MKRLACILFVLIACVLVMSARSHYATVYNQFGSLVSAVSWAQHGNLACEMVDNRLTVDNGSSHSIAIADTTFVPASGYQYLVRAAALHNQPGRSYVVTDSLGNKKRVERTSWGVIFAYANPSHYMHVEISSFNSNFYDDLTDKRQMTVEVWRHQGNSANRICSIPLDDGVDLYDGLNTLMVSVDKGQAVISVGKKKLKAVATVELSDDDVSLVKTGLFLGAGSKIAVERTVLSTQSDPPRRVATTWTRESLDQHFAISSDPLEGYWQYQDRDMEDKWLRLGGRYTVALVASHGGYDIIYVDGSQVNAPQWQFGLLKGHISRTIFDGHYDLVWIDAMFAPITHDAYAAFENGVLMTLSFPVYNSQLRLSKVLQP